MLQRRIKDSQTLTNDYISRIAFAIVECLILITITSLTLSTFRKKKFFFCVFLVKQYFSTFGDNGVMLVPQKKGCSRTKIKGLPNADYELPFYWTTINLERRERGNDDSFGSRFFFFCSMTSLNLRSSTIRCQTTGTKMQTESSHVWCMRSRMKEVWHGLDHFFFFFGSFQRYRYKTRTNVTLFFFVEWFLLRYVWYMCKLQRQCVVAWRLTGAAQTNWKKTRVVSFS